MNDQNSFNATQARFVDACASTASVHVDVTNADSTYDYDAMISDAHDVYDEMGMTAADWEWHYFELAYENLVDGFDTSTSLHEPFSYNTLRSALWNWLPARYAGRFVAGTLICPESDDSQPSLHIPEPDKIFFAFTHGVDGEVRRDSEGRLAFKSHGVAAIRTRLGSTGLLQHRFLMEIPDHFALADMKEVCLSSGSKARSDSFYPMQLVGCESAAEWIDLLMTHRQPHEYIDSFAEWHWRMPSPRGKKVPRKGWARRRALAAIGRA